MYFPARLRAGLLAGACTMACVCATAPAHAQNAQSVAAPPAAPDATSSGEIIVTGSRIARPSLDSPQPVTSMTIGELTRGGNANIGDQLAKLPQLTPTITQASSTGGGLAIGTSGLDVLDLRGFGPDRTLVLVDGKRQVTSNEGYFWVDTNTIPTDLISRVDVVTGGSSAVYGSDAMAGVVNFVLKNNFEGLSVNASGGISSHKDRGTYSVSGTWGKNFAGGRGNIAVALSYDQANTVNYDDRPGLTGAFDGRNQFQIVNPAGSDDPRRTFLSGVHSFGYADGGAFIPYGGTNPLSCNKVVGSCLANGFPRVFQFQQDGSLTEANYGKDFRPDGSNNNQGGTGSVLNNTGVLIPGYKRYVADVIGHYDVSDAFRPYFDAKFVRVISDQSNSPTFSQGGAAQTAGSDPLNYLIYTPISLDNAYLTPQARTLIQSMLPAGTTFFNLNRNNIDLGSRGEHDRRDTYRIVAGFKGTFNTDWHYDVSAEYGVLKTKYDFTNNRIEQNFYNAIDAVFNARHEIVCRVNQVTVTDPNCHPIDLPGSSPTAQSAADRQAALNYFNTTSHRWGKATQLDINATVDGNTSKFFNLPGGPVRFAVGGEYRRETAGFHYDPLVANGETFLNSSDAFDPPSFEVKEVYAEVEVPILKDMPLIQELSLSGAGRYADYKGTTGAVWAYNGAAIYAPVRDIKFRVNYSHSVRAPTLNDLYSPNFQNYDIVNDPCDVDYIDTGKSTRAANCAAAGVPVGFQNPGTRAGSLSFVTGGNPNLKAETSRSWTYGVILQPRWVPGLAITVDYYDIKIANVISQISAQQILDGCYDGATLNNSFCALINPRNADHTFSDPALLQSSLNFAQQRAKGIDFDVSYNRRFNEDNKLQLHLIGSWSRFRTDYPYLDDPTEPSQLKGSLGYPVWRFSLLADYTYKKFTFGYTMRFVGKQSITSYDAQHEVAGEDGTPLDPLYADRADYPSVIYHDVRASYDLNDHFTLYAGVDNVADKKPPFGLLGNGEDYNGQDGIFDNIGRFLYAGIKAKF